MFKLLACALFVTVLSSFVEVDPCKFTDDQVRANCEYSSNETCWLSWSGGSCDGHTESFPYNRFKN